MINSRRQTGTDLPDMRRGVEQHRLAPMDAFTRNSRDQTAPTCSHDYIPNFLRVELAFVHNTDRLRFATDVLFAQIEAFF